MASKGGTPTSSLSLPTANTARQHLGTKKKSDTKQVHPGYSMFDWNKLCNSGEVDMTGTAGKMLRVTPEELARHCTDGDLWTAVRGVVYNITHFTKFHPGGKAQLKRGAGNDCTELFDKIHVWVNSEAILEKCIVGYLVGTRPPTKSSSLKVAVQKPPFPGTGGSDDLGEDVLSLHVPSVGGGGTLSMADAGKLQQVVDSPSSTDDSTSISIPIPTISTPSLAVPSLNTTSAGGISIPVPGSENVDSTSLATSDNGGTFIPVPTNVEISIPVLGSREVNSLPSYITDHPLISKTAYETAV